MDSTSPSTRRQQIRSCRSATPGRPVTPPETRQSVLFDLPLDLMLSPSSRKRGGGNPPHRALQPQCADPRALPCRLSPSLPTGRAWPAFPATNLLHRLEFGQISVRIKPGETVPLCCLCLGVHPYCTVVCRGNLAAALLN